LEVIGQARKAMNPWRWLLQGMTKQELEALKLRIEEKAAIP
jgi:hypothetical protein